MTVTSILLYTNYHFFSVLYNENQDASASEILYIFLDEYCKNKVIIELVGKQNVIVDTVGQEHREAHHEHQLTAVVQEERARQDIMMKNKKYSHTHYA